MSYSQLQAEATKTTDLTKRFQIFKVLNKEITLQYILITAIEDTKKLKNLI